MKFNSIVQEYKQWGFLRFVHLCTMTALRPWLFLTVINIRPHYRSPTMPELAPNRAVRIATREELLAACNDPVYEMTPEFVEAALARGEFCIAAFDDDKIIAYVWRAFGPTPHADGLWVAFDSKYRYGFKALTLRDYRQQRLQHVIGLLTDPMMLEQGYTHGIGFIETHNFPSLISDAKRGHQHVGYAGYVRLGRHVFPFRSPGAKRHGFEFFKPALEKRELSPSNVD